MPSQCSFLTQQEMLCAYSPSFIIYLLSQPLGFQWISDNRKAGKYPASLCNGVDESDRTYQNMRANALTDAELRRKAADELSCMTARINRGEAIPEPVKQLPVMGGRPLNRAQALAKIAEIKAKFGLKGASV